MGQKANPIANRLGIIKGWDSNWFGGRNYGDKLAEDDKIRQYKELTEGHHFFVVNNLDGSVFRTKIDV